MNVMDSYDAFKYWLSCHLHFTSENYDVVKYRSRVKSLDDKYNKLTVFEKNKFKFIGKKFDDKAEYCKAMIAAYMNGVNPRYDPIADVVRAYEEFITRKQSMKYVLLKNHDFFQDMLDSYKPENKTDQVMMLLNLYIQNKVSPEYVLMQDKFDNFLDSCYNDIIFIAFKQEILKLRKYRLLFNTEKYSEEFSRN